MIRLAAGDAGSQTKRQYNAMETSSNSGQNNQRQRLHQPPVWIVGVTGWAYMGLPAPGLLLALSQTQGQALRRGLLTTLRRSQAPELTGLAVHRVTLFVVIMHKSPKRDYQYPIHQIDKILIRKIDYLLEQTCKTRLSPPLSLLSVVSSCISAQCLHR